MIKNVFQFVTINSYLQLVLDLSFKSTLRANCATKSINYFFQGCFQIAQLFFFKKNSNYKINKSIYLLGMWLNLSNTFFCNVRERSSESLSQATMERSHEASWHRRFTFYPSTFYPDFVDYESTHYHIRTRAHAMQPEQFLLSIYWSLLVY